MKNTIKDWFKRNEWTVLACLCGALAFANTEHFYNGAILAVTMGLMVGHLEALLTRDEQRRALFNQVFEQIDILKALLLAPPPSDTVPRDQKYYIWNHERGMWWRGSRHGYTDKLAEAGQFSGEETLDILKDGNYSRQVAQTGRPEETAVPIEFLHHDLT